jgi:O-antigen/teichoic acid export membrane protein
MSKPMIKQAEQDRAKTWITRFIKFNFVGFFVFLIGTAIFVSVFPYFGAWAWVIGNGTSSILQFALISYFNKKKKGLMFEQNLTEKSVR